MTKSVAGKVIAVTGGARGIGLATATLLHSLSANIGIGDIDESAVNEAGSRLGLGVHCGLDVTDPQSFTDFLDTVEGQLGAIDVLVNNAGIIAVGHAIDEVDTVTRRVLEVNAYGVILGTKLAAQRMLPRARGHIINVVSVGGVLPSAGIATYCATKHAVLGFTDTMRLENRTSGVHFSAVLPSLTNTEMIAGVGKAKGIKNADPEDVAKSIAGLIVKPKPRVVVPRSMGVVVLTQRLLPQRVSEALGRVLGTEHVFTDAVDPEKRKDYAARVGTS